MSDFRYTKETVGVIRLHAKTMSAATIATIMRCSVGTVELICRRHDIEMRDSDRVEPEPSSVAARRLRKQVDIEVDGVSFALVANEARRRGLTARELMARLIESVADDLLFSAVLDR